MTIQKDIDYVKKLLPDHYQITSGETKHSNYWIRCKSRIGIKKKEPVEDEDDEHWGYVMDGLRSQFGQRFQEVDHSTCTFHIDFTIYLRKN